MFGVSFVELGVIFLVALIVFGPERLPEIARTLGRITGELRKASDAFRKELYNSVYTPADTELRNAQRSINGAINSLGDTVKNTTADSKTLIEQKPVPLKEKPDAEPKG